MNHAHHHIMKINSYSLAHRDLGAFGTINQSAVSTVKEPVGSGLILQDLWYYQFWVTVCNSIVLVLMQN